MKRRHLTRPRVRRTVRPDFPVGRLDVDGNRWTLVVERRHVVPVNSALRRAWGDVRMPKLVGGRS